MEALSLSIFWIDWKFNSWLKNSSQQVGLLHFRCSAPARTRICDITHVPTVGGFFVYVMCVANSFRAVRKD